MDTKFCGKSHPSLYNHPRPPRPFFMFFLELVKLLARSKIVLNHSPEVVVSISNFYIFHTYSISKSSKSWQKVGKSHWCVFQARTTVTDCHRILAFQHARTSSDTKPSIICIAAGRGFGGINLHTLPKREWISWTSVNVNKQELNQLSQLSQLSFHNFCSIFQIFKPK